MSSHSLPSTAAEEIKAKKRIGEAVKPRNRGSKRTSSTASARHHSTTTSIPRTDSRRKRVWKACERCRTKKTKCDGVFPCERCKDDGLVCTASIRKKMTYKQLPRGYAEVIESNQLTLIATIHKLYSMVRNSQPWDQGEVGVNSAGRPIIHEIAQKLGCLRSNYGTTASDDSLLPEDESSMTLIARQLEGKQSHEQNTATSAVCGRKRAELVASSDSYQSDFEQDYGDFASADQKPLSLPSNNFTGDNDFGSRMTPVNPDFSVIPLAQSSSMPDFSSWPAALKPDQQQLCNNTPILFVQPPASPQSWALMSQETLDVDFYNITPSNVSYADTNDLIDIADRMIYADHDGR